MNVVGIPAKWSEGLTGKAQQKQNQPQNIKHCDRQETVTMGFFKRTKKPARRITPDPTARLHRVTYTFRPITQGTFQHCLFPLEFPSLQVANFTVNQP